MVILVVDLYENYPGQMKNNSCFTVRNIDSSKRRVFNLKLYSDVIDKFKETRFMDYKKEELIPLLVVRA